MKINRAQKTALLTALLSLSSLFGFLPKTLPSVKANVIGQDDRVTPDYAWMTRGGQQRAAFGQLEVQQQDGRFFRCSFAVVGRNLGLTNAHCVMDEQGRLASQIKAYAVRHGNYSNSASRYYAIATLDWIWRGITYSPSTAADFAQDWAIIRFTTNLGDTTGWLGNEAFGDGGRSMVNRLTNYIGYPSDWPTPANLRSGDVRGQTPALHSSCSFLRLDTGVLLHNCDTAPGASGSNMYAQLSDTDLRLMGLHSSSGWRLTNGQLANGAVPLDAFMPLLQRLRQSGGR